MNVSVMPNAVAVTWNVPAMPLLVRRARARPSASDAATGIVALAVPAPPSTIAQVAVCPDTGLPNVSLKATTSGLSKRSG